MSNVGFLELVVLYSKGQHISISTVSILTVFFSFFCLEGLTTLWTGSAPARHRPQSGKMGESKNTVSLWTNVSIISEGCRE